MKKATLDKNIDLSKLSQNLKTGFQYLNNTNFEYIADGKYEIDGEDVFVNIQTYQTKNDADFEAHRKYIDIQYIISGKENIGLTDYKNCETTIPYNSEKDIEFLSGDGEFESLKEGEYMILYPQDAHKPSISQDVKNPERVRKAVVKVRI
jgi:YhcH/YjgK/YiaL family protein